MKTLFLTLFLWLNTSIIASDYDYELTPVIGFNIAEGNLHLKNYAIYGVELQFNDVDSVIKPELSFLYSSADYEKNLLGYEDLGDTTVSRIALNGVYEYKKIASIIPLVKAGIGYEFIDDPYHNNRNSLFFDLGAGVKIPFSNSMALKLEAIYMIKDNDTRHDSNLALLAGLNIAFGEKSQKTAPFEIVEPEVTKVTEPVIEKIIEPKLTNILEPVIEKITEPKVTNILAPVIEEIIEPPVLKITQALVDGDDDKDGVSNSKDKCPNTHPNVTKVDTDGCAMSVNLHVKFEFNSSKISKNSYSHIMDFANFMNEYKSYKAILEGHTDSIGTKSYNMLLSQKRVNIVTKFIIEKGKVDASRLLVIAKGESEPLVSNDTKENRAKNRRIQAHITKN